MSQADSMGQAYPNGRIYSAGRRRLALRQQFNVLSGLLFREAEMRHGQSFALGYIASGIEPLVIVATIGLLFSALAKTPPYGGSLLLFLGTGVFPIYLFIHTSLRLRQPLNAGAQRQRYPAERPFDHIAIHALLHILSSAIVTVLFFGGLYYLGGVNAAIPEDPLAALSALAAVLLFGIATGICNSVIARLFPLGCDLARLCARLAALFRALFRRGVPAARQPLVFRAQPGDPWRQLVSTRFLSVLSQPVDRSQLPAWRSPGDARLWPAARSRNAAPSRGKGLTP